VCLRVYNLSVREHISGTARSVVIKILCMLPMAVARSFFGDDAILPVLWMTLFLHIMGHMEAFRYRCSE